MALSVLLALYSPLGTCEKATKPVNMGSHKHVAET